jgi:hypothetical protein
LILPRSKKKVAETPQQLVPADDRAGEKPAFSSEAYNKVARAAKLEGLILEKASFNVGRGFFKTRAKDASILKYAYESACADVQFNKKDGVASCSWTWGVDATIRKKNVLLISATYQVFYSNLLECEEVAVTRFLQRVGRFATYPYFRAHVSQVSWESGTNLPLLPTIAT